METRSRGAIKGQQTKAWKKLMEEKKQDYIRSRTTKYIKMESVGEFKDHNLYHYIDIKELAVRDDFELDVLKNMFHYVAEYLDPLDNTEDKVIIFNRKFNNKKVYDSITKYNEKFAKSNELADLIFDRAVLLHKYYTYNKEMVKRVKYDLYCGISTEISFLDYSREKRWDFDKFGTRYYGDFKWDYKLASCDQELIALQKERTELLYQYRH